MLKKYLMLLLSALTLTASAQAATPRKAFVVPENPDMVNKIVAVVNGERITKFDVERRAMPEFMRRGINPGNSVRREEIDKIYQNVLDTQVNEILFVQEAARLKIEVSDADVDKEVTKLLQQSKLSRDAFDKQLEKEGSDMKSLRERIHRNLMGQRLLAQMVGRKTIVDKEEVARYYAENKESLKVITEVRMAILVYPPNINAETVAQQIASGRLRFEDAVRRHSIDPATRNKGGEMPPAPWKDMAPEWRKRLGDMKPGDVSGIFSIQQFKAQVKLLEKVGDTKERTLEEATPEIEAILREPLLQARYAEYTQWLRGRALVDMRGL